MDLLSHFLTMLKIESTSISSWHLSEPWGVHVRDYQPGFCFIVTEGRFVVETAVGQVLHLAKGDTLLAPRGGECRLLSRLGVAATDLHELNWSELRSPRLDRSAQPGSAITVAHGGGGERCRLLGLAFSIHSGQGAFVLGALPDFIVLRDCDASILSLTRPAIEALLSDNKPGYYAVAKHMAELIMVGLLRSYILSDKNFSPGWIKGLQDPYICKALLAIHEAPQHKWNVQLLAAAANLSRSTFAARFCRLIGQSPIDYLNGWRINLAVELLRGGTDSVAHIASAVGYQSDRVFRQAFRERMSMSPRQYRHQQFEMDKRIKKGLLSTDV
ncbi:AraC family transcriptional regulator [Pseudomonas stutzeri]|uniref:AraC family transcriptional regulator n=1 Tax=Stutzerimonas stutzeri TaxID=316 RepID=UPI001F518C54|nr:AraC family transcriptional regulator [Stutzerimonas stutzeri]MCI0916267.1 AraC family transcriptional regulator [Stutzerimonas stutzeri]